MSDLAPILAVTSPPALVLVAVRSFRLFARAVVQLLASVVAIVTHDQERREACLSIVDKVTRRASGPPAWPRRRAIDAADQPDTLA